MVPGHGEMVPKPGERLQSATLADDYSCGEAQTAVAARSGCPGRLAARSLNGALRGNTVARRRLSYEQRPAVFLGDQQCAGDSLVESRQGRAMVGCQLQQVPIGDLFGLLDPSRQAIRTQTVIQKREQSLFLHAFEIGLRNTDITSKAGRATRDSHKSKLCDATRRQAHRRIHFLQIGQLSICPHVQVVAAIADCEQHIDIEQINHGNVPRSSS
jgi:hypothetical protein